MEERAPPGIVLRGPFWTRARVARHLHRSPGAVDEAHDLVRIPSRVGGEAVYPSFQFDAVGVRPEVATLNLLLHRRVDDLRACDWYVTPLATLGRATPIRSITIGGDLEHLLRVLPEPLWPAPGPAGDDPGWRRVWGVRRRGVQMRPLPVTHH